MHDNINCSIPIIRLLHLTIIKNQYETGAKLGKLAKRPVQPVCLR